MYQYVVSAQKPTKVTHVVKGNFMSETELNLILCKSTRIELHSLTPDGLLAQFDLGIYGRVATCKLYRPAGEKRDLLFVATERRQYFVLSYDKKSGKIVTKAKGEIVSRVNRSNENGSIGIVDPEGRMIGLNVFQGQFDVIPMDSRGQLKEAFNIRLEEINVIDIQFLHGYSVPTICVLYEDNRNNRSTRHIKTYGISLKDKVFTEGPWNQPNVDLETNMIIPIPEPAGGVLILGLETIAYRNGRASGRSGQAGTTVAIPVKCGLVKAFAPIDSDGLRWLLCDEWGGLHVIALQVDRVTGSAALTSGAVPAPSAGTSAPQASSSTAISSTSGGVNTQGLPVQNRATASVVDLTMEFLGETSIASSIAYLDNGYVFIGSSYGDSQLIRLSETKDEETDSYVQVVQTIINLGPIVDFCVVDLDRQGQGQVITCSGAFKDGSLRVVRNGIGIDEQAGVKLEGIKDMWSLRSSFESSFDHYLVQTFVNETRILAIEDEELSEVDIGGFDQNKATLTCGNMRNDLILQVTNEEARLVSCSDVTKPVQVWSPEEGKRITVASCNAAQMLIALGGGELILFELNAENKLEQRSSCTLEHEVACIDIGPLDSQGSNTTPQSTDVAAIGMWSDVTIRILALPSLQEVHREPLGVETIPRSLCFVTLEGYDHLLAGLGDGKLITFSITRGATDGKVLTNRKKIALGSRPISLSKFRSKDAVHVFAGTDRPTVIYSNGYKLLYSNVNQREVTCMTPFNTKDFPDCLALASEDELTIGTINEIQKLHIRSHYLGEQPRRICHQKSSRTFGLCSVRSGTGAFRATKIADDTSAAVSMDIDGSGTNGLGLDEPLDMIETSYVRLLDDITFDVLDSFQLDEFETGCSIICCSFYDEAPNSSSANDSNAAAGGGNTAFGANKTSSSSSHMEVSGDSSTSQNRAEERGTGGAPAQGKEYIVVGTAYSFEGEQEPSKGRILVFEVVDAANETNLATPQTGEHSGTRRLLLVTEKQIRGAAYCLNAFNGKLLASINSKVRLFAFSDKGPDQSELVTKCGHHEHIVALYIASRGDSIIVGDMMKSISLLAYRGLEDHIEEVARDYNANNMTGVGILDDDTYIGAETYMNLFTVQKNSTAMSEEARHMLKVTGEFHLGEFVNMFRHGSLVMQDSQQGATKLDDLALTSDAEPQLGPGVPESVKALMSSSPKPEMLFATVNGVLGVIASLSEGQYKLLKRLEQALREVIQGVGGLSHANWRSYVKDSITSPSKGFVDGDLIEAFLDLDAEDAQKVVDLVNGTVALQSDVDITSILGHSSNVPASDSLTLNLDTDSLSRFVEDLTRLH